MRGYLIFLLALILTVNLGFSAGFGLGEFGGRASAMGNAVTAQAYDASTLFYNPAGLGFLEGTHFYGGVTLIIPSANFVGAKPIFDKTVYEAEDQIFPPVGVYFAHKFTEKFGAGISLTNPFGLGLAWGDEFPGRAISKDVTLASYYITPQVAYKILPGVSIAAGLDVVLSDLILQRNVLLFNTEDVGGTGTEVGEVELEGTSNVGYGFTAGIMYQGDRLGLGAMYRHSVNNKVEEGDANFTLFNKLDPKLDAFANALLVDQNVSTEIDFPNYFVAGIYYKLMENLGAEVDFAWYGWEVFEELPIRFDDSRLNQTIPENYENAIQIRFGAHYELTENVSVRAGYIYDETPQPIESVSPLLPDDTRNDYSIGLGYHKNGFRFDGGYMLVDIGDRSTVENGKGKNDNDFDGTYNSRADLFFLSIGYSFGGY